MTSCLDHALLQPGRPRRPVRRAAALCSAAVPLAATSALAAAALHGGYETHRQGEVPTAREGIPFRFSGDLDTVGNFAIIEHHHPRLRKSSIVTRSMELAALSLCHLEVRQRQVTRISHYGGKTRTVFTHQIDPRVGPRPLTRYTDPHLDRATLDLLREALSLDTLIPPDLRSGEITIGTATGLKDDRIAGRDCRWVHTPPPLESRSCMLREGIGMPINEGLSAAYGSVVDGRPVVLIRSRVVRFDGPTAIPASVFERGASVSLDHPSPNATTRWCEAEAARTGINRCEKRSHARGK